MQVQLSAQYKDQYLSFIITSEDQKIFNLTLESQGKPLPKSLPVCFTAKKLVYGWAFTPLLKNDDYESAINEMLKKIKKK